MSSLFSIYDEKITTFLSLIVDDMRLLYKQKNEIQQIRILRLQRVLFFIDLYKQLHIAHVKI